MHKLVAELNLGDVIVTQVGPSKKRTRVEKITRCPASVKSIPWFHINEKDCYFSQSLVETEEN